MLWKRFCTQIRSDFHTDHGLHRANLHKWGFPASELCDCSQRQTMGHIVDSCPLTSRLPCNIYCVGGDVKHCTIQSPLTQLNGGLKRLHKVADAVPRHFLQRGNDAGSTNKASNGKVYVISSTHKHDTRLTLSGQVDLWLAQAPPQSSSR